MGKMYQITDTLWLSTKGRSNFVKLRDGLPIPKAALRELVKKGAVTNDGKPVLEVLRAFNERYT